MSDGVKHGVKRDVKPGAKPDGTPFLSRWSRRKAEAKDAAQEGVVEAQQPPSKSSTGAVTGAKVPETPHPEPTLPDESEHPQALPSIDTLTHEADFSPFMAKDVDPGLRNLAMKKLFADPHYQFGQMDKLDIYIDDYSRPDPIPLEMLRQMNQAKSLFLFDDDAKDAPQPADAPAGQAEGAVEVKAGKDEGTHGGAPAADRIERADAHEEDAPEENVGLAGKADAGKAR